MSKSFSNFDEDPQRDRPEGDAIEKLNDLTGFMPPLPIPDGDSKDDSGFELAYRDDLTTAWNMGAVDQEAPGALSPDEPESSEFERTDESILSEVRVPGRIGDYVIERMIGSGGMGRVFLAKHQTMQRTVAIKTLPPEQASQTWAVERFYEEVRAAARLMHPNIATAFDAGHSSGVHFLAMEYIDGETLTNVVASDGPLSIVDAVSAIRGAARGLAHAHAAGVIHRDVKPSNLMRSSDGMVKVVDLGLALFATPQQLLQTKRDASAKAPGRLLGTVAFMSPEQLENPDFVDARSDIYSLGATLYFLLTGRPPYEGEFLDQIRGIRHDPLPELFAFRPDVDLRLEHVFRRMMAKRPQERYASLMEVLADLATYDTGDTGTSWLSGLGLPNFVSDSSTHRGGSTSGEVAKVLGIDLGMFYATCAVAEPAGNVDVLTTAEEKRSQQRLAIADGTPLVFGEAAALRRELQPGSVLHCIPLYLGQSRVDHLINGRKCPAEALLAMQIRKLIDNCWVEKGYPHAVAITVPSSYDQFHRQAIVQAATIAGIRSVRLVDRSMAVLQSWRHDQRLSCPSRESIPTRSEAAPSTEIYGERPQVVVSIAGNATEVVVARYRGSRIQQLASVGQWHYGTLQWQQKLVDMVAESCIKNYEFDPRHTLQEAAQLQVACERALPKFLLLETANISFRRGNQPVAIVATRTQWLEECEPLLNELLQMIDASLEAADINPERVGQCFLFGLLARIGANRQRIEKKFGSDTEFILIERSDVARGAAICVAGELPGRGDIPLPPQPSTTHDFGLLVVDAKNRRRIRPIIPRGTAIPARTNRRIATGGKATTQVLTVVESSTWQETSWRSLGSHRFEYFPEDAFVELTFEVDVDGRLVIRQRDSNTGGYWKLPSVPKATLSPQEVVQWAEQVKEWMPSSKRRTM